MFYLQAEIQYHYLRERLRNLRIDPEVLVRARDTLVATPKLRLLLDEQGVSLVAAAKNDLHPTMKPVALVERAIRNSSKSRDNVLDLFGGSGTTMIAAERTGRRARLLELDPRYVDVIVQRWEDTTGGRASHAATGSRFRPS